jgi:hypothetical protein
MGRTARFEQIYVASLEAEPVENETLTGVNSILTREIEANEIKLDTINNVKGRLALSNAVPTKQFSLGNKLFMDKDDTIVFDLKERGRASRFFVTNQLAVGTTNPTKAFQVNSGATRKVDIDLTSRNLMTVSGNLVSTNVIVNDKLTLGSNIIVDSLASNVISVVGAIQSSNVNVGSNIAFSDEGSNVAIINGNVFQNGYLNLVGNISVTGNITVSETATYIAAQDLRVANVVIHSGFGNDVLSRETAIVMTPGVGYSNVAVGFVGGARGREMAFFQTDAYGGYNSAQINVDDTKLVNVHVYGDIYTSNNIGANNTFPTHDLCVGSNLFVEDTGSNILEVTGNTYTQKLKVGSGGISVGNLLTIEPGAEAPVVINSNVRMNALRTTGTAPSGISNLTPTDTLSIGSKIYANTTAINTLRVLGNTATTNLRTEMVLSASSLTVHGDRFGGDSTSNVLTLKAGPRTANVSVIEVYGASTSNTHQNIRFKTKNTERMRIASNGNVGIGQTNPSKKLTVNGNVFVMGSNSVVYGNTWGSTGNTAMQVYSSPNSGENRIENIVGAGKGLKIFASKTPTMGTPKITILETSNVGINTGNPVGRLHTSGGTVFINNPIQYTNGYNHLKSPLVVSNTNQITTTADVGNVLELCREGNATRDGVRALFKMGKYDDGTGASRSKLDIFLSDARYTDESEVLTLRADGRVGIGTTQPSAHLEVYSTGVKNPTTNGLLVHNHEGSSGDAIVTMQTDLNLGNAFTSYIQSDGDSDDTLSGWAVGVSGSRDFRITQNYETILDSASTAIYIDGTSRDVGIGTDVPRGRLEVVGNVVIGNQLTFGGLAGDEFGNTHIIERRYTAGQARTELLLFKGNESSGVATGPDRIRHIAAEHVFQTYTSSGDTFDNILVEKDGESNKPLVVCDNGIVVVGGNRDDADGRGVNTKLVVNGDIEFSGEGSFRLTGFEFETSDLVSVGNIIRNKLDGSTRRPLTFVHEVDSFIDSEFARFDEDGRFALGTTTPTSNIHVYDTTPGNVDIMRLQSTGVNKQTGVLLYTNDGEGGFLRGFSNTVNKTTGLALGVSNNSTIINNLNLIHTSNVGVGTPVPVRQFHVVDHRNPLLGGTGVMRVESKLSNASVEFTTSAGTSNIYADRTGNVYIQPSSINKPTTYLKSDLDVEGDMVVGGNIDFTQIAVGLGGTAASTDIEVGGGSIVGSNEVSRKTYSKTFTVAAGDAKDIQLMFGAGAFYAKVTAILRRTDGSTVGDLSTMIIELQGGTGDESTPSLDLAIGTKNLFGGTNSYPWSPIITTGTRGISIEPYNTENTREYNYDIFIELVSACGGKLEKITRSLGTEADLDSSGGATDIATFNY